MSKYGSVYCQFAKSAYSIRDVFSIAYQRKYKEKSNV